MATTITKAEFDALPESLKGKFTADGNNYSLVEEDVEGLKKSKAEILAEKKAMADKLAALEKFKSEYEAGQTAAEDEKLKQAGEFEELKKRILAKHDEEKAGYEKRIAELLGNVKRERLTNELIAKGVLPDRAKYALADIENQIDLEAGENGFALKVKNGIGDANEFEKLVEGFKAQSPFLFAAEQAAGSGASGNGGNGVGTPKTASKQQVKAMSPETKREFYLNGGEVTD